MKTFDGVDKFAFDFEREYRGALEVEVARHLYGAYSRSQQPWDRTATHVQERWLERAQELCDIFDASDWARLE